MWPVHDLYLQSISFIGFVDIDSIFLGGSYCSGGFFNKKKNTGLGLSAIAFQSLRITFVT